MCIAPPLFHYKHYHRDCNLNVHHIITFLTIEDGATVREVSGLVGLVRQFTLGISLG